MEPKKTNPPRKKPALNSIEGLLQRQRQQEQLNTIIIPYGSYDKRANMGTGPQRPNADYQGPMGRGGEFGWGTRDKMPGTTKPTSTKSKKKGQLI